MPLPVNTNSLVGELRRTLTEIDKQMEAAKRHVMMEYPVNVKPTEDAIYRAQDRNGSFLMTPLLVAKAQCLSAIASLQAPVKR